MALEQRKEGSMDAQVPKRMLFLCASRGDGVSGVMSCLFVRRVRGKYLSCELADYKADTAAVEVGCSRERKRSENCALEKNLLLAMSFRCREDCISGVWCWR